MPSIVAEGGKAWDFGPVYDLLHNLSSLVISTDDADAGGDPHPLSSNTRVRPVSPRTESEGLGDFRAIWDFMGVDPKSPPPRVRPPSPSPLPRAKRNNPQVEETRLTVHNTASDLPPGDIVEVEDTVTVAIEENKDYASDGAIYHTQRTKGVRWQREPELSDLDDHDTAESEIPADTTSADEAGVGANTTTTSSPSKARTKEERQRAKKAKRVVRDQHWRECATRKGITDEEYAKLNKKQKKQIAALDAKRTRAVSDAETEKPSKKQTPAKKASVRPIVVEPTTPTPASRYNLRSGGPSSSSPVKAKQTQAVPKTPKGTGKKSKKGTSGLPEVKADSSATPKPAIPQSEPQRKKTDSSSQPVIPHTEVKPSQFAVTDFDQSPLLRKSQDLSAMLSQAQGLPRQGPLMKNLVQAPSLQPMNIPPPTQPRVLAPAPQLASSTPGFVMRHGEDRHFHFLLELISQFSDDRKWLVAPVQMANHNNNAAGIHVFVDASNIFIGFKEYMRRTFGLPFGKQVQGLEISFDSLVLLMERRRPVAKRVLVGSYPNLPAFDMAKAVGYETNILEQVYKNKDISKSSKKHIYIRQSSKAIVDALGPGAATPSAVAPTTPGAVAGSSGPLMVQKWVEQGVDEILHLKMLESVVDADEPGTMVLATGDAAVAEYSQGFLKMVERALKKGWCVELLAWRDGMNQAYLNRAFREQWGDKFRVTELDAWAGDLVNT